MPFKARFVEPMLLLRQEQLPKGSDWLYEIKLDDYGRLRSRRTTRWSVTSSTAGYEFLTKSWLVGISYKW